MTTKKLKYSVEVGRPDAPEDTICLRTDDFREALNRYEELVNQLENLKHACSYAVVVFYVLCEAHTVTIDYTPVAMARLESVLVED